MAGFLLTLPWLLVLSIAPFVLVEVAVSGYRWLRMTTLFLAGLSAVAGVLWRLFGSVPTILDLPLSWPHMAAV